MTTPWPQFHKPSLPAMPHYKPAVIWSENILSPNNHFSLAVLQIHYLQYPVSSLFYSINLLSLYRTSPLSVVTSQLRETRSCEKACPKGHSILWSVLIFPLETFPTDVSNCSFPVLESFNEFVSTQQQFQGNKCFQLFIFPILSHYSSLRIHCSFHLSCLEATALLPEEILSMLMPAPADFDWTAPTGFIRLQKSLLHSVVCTWWEFIHQGEINWKITAEQTGKP